MGAARDRERLAQIIANSKKLTIKRCDYTGHANKIVLLLQLDSGSAKFVCAITEILNVKLSNTSVDPSLPSCNNGLKLAPFKGYQNYTKEDLERMGLPLYLSDDWLLDQYSMLGSAAEISRKYGYSDTTLSRHLHRLGLRRNKRVTQEQRRKAKQLFEQGHTYSEVAKMTGIAKGSIRRILKSEVGGD